MTEIEEQLDRLQEALRQVEECCSPPDPDNLLPSLAGLSERVRELARPLAQPASKQPGVQARLKELQQRNQRISILLALWRHHTIAALRLLVPNAQTTYSYKGITRTSAESRHLGNG